MTTSPRHKLSFKLWLETDEGMVFGPGLYQLLKKVSDLGTLKASAEGLGMSYRFAWGLIRKAEGRIGQPLVISHKGGKSGGGGFKLTEMGQQFIEEFLHIELILNELLVNRNTIDLDHPFTQVNATVKERADMEGKTVLTVTMDLQDIELSLPKDILRDVKPGDPIIFELLALPSSLEKAEN
ncbi:hypothetical protein CL673_08930 [Candidatus Bathyarchaeota archaeon]|jgi:molybdate transport repressor ModE-like protein|nr:hypothetical protein [Candidatus Bathyarchaeota archaeon]MDP6048916.1 LysR family transcriptional regulator [Candidatus Bathyarchaeota archaeon]MDP7207206.1 LysR family transcriptional regulator [Candidatus Bathyarchaeota archaeon]MDP7443353.1 LysR family transcriptional regulator [Candidatus Bathyarchaeota archaeon]